MAAALAPQGEVAAELRKLQEMLPPLPVPRPVLGPKPPSRVQVMCRFRGPSPVAPWAWELRNSEHGGSVGALIAGTRAGGFVFDRVFGPEASQKTVYDTVEPVIRDVLHGGSSTVLCYGQTSAGKTFTMEGPPGIGGLPLTSEELGIIPRALATLFMPGSTKKIRISFLEIYLERLRDLLAPDNAAVELRIEEGRHGDVRVAGLREVAADSLASALQIFRLGLRRRAVAATSLNERSSRSHSIFIVRVERASWQRRSDEAGGDMSGEGKLCLVDLAGSECLKRAAAGSTVSITGELASEARSINRSLSTLGLVIGRLADCSKTCMQGRVGHVPYRSSKLTRVLQDALGGEGKTMLVLNCSLAVDHFAETLSTLRFGARARAVTALPAAPERPIQVLAKTLKAARMELQRLKTCMEADRGFESAGPATPPPRLPAWRRGSPGSSPERGTAVARGRLGAPGRFDSLLQAACAQSAGGVACPDATVEPSPAKQSDFVTPMELSPLSLATPRTTLSAPFAASSHFSRRNSQMPGLRKDEGESSGAKVCAWEHPLSSWEQRQLAYGQDRHELLAARKKVKKLEAERTQWAAERVSLGAECWALRADGEWLRWLLAAERPKAQARAEAASGAMRLNTEVPRRSTSCPALHHEIEGLDGQDDAPAPGEEDAHSQQEAQQDQAQGVNQDVHGDVHNFKDEQYVDGGSFQRSTGSITTAPSFFVSFCNSLGDPQTTLGHVLASDLLMVCLLSTIIYFVMVTL